MDEIDETQVLVFLLRKEISHRKAVNNESKFPQRSGDQMDEHIAHHKQMAARYEDIRERFIDTLSQVN